MRVEAIHEYLRMRPFVPMRIFLSNGDTHDISHPEMMIASRLGVIIALEPGDDGIPDRVAYCDPVHIVKFEPINGHGQTVE